MGKDFYPHNHHPITMNPINKYLTLTLTILLLTSPLTLTTTQATTNPSPNLITTSNNWNSTTPTPPPPPTRPPTKPSVPQFNIKFVDYSYDVPSESTTTIDQYTGEKITNTTPGYHIENKTIEITIKNQPFTPYNDSKGINYYLYFFVQSKGYFGDEWQEWGSTVQNINPYGGGFRSWTPELYVQGSVVSCPANYAAGAQVDFRVEARIGHYYCLNPDSIFGFFAFEADVTSGWSKVQAFTMPGASSSSPQTTPPQNPTTPPNNNQPQQPDQTQPPNFILHPTLLLWTGTLLFIGTIIAGVMIFLRGPLKAIDYNNASTANDQVIPNT